MAPLGRARHSPTSHRLAPSWPPSAQEDPQVGGSFAVGSQEQLSVQLLRPHLSKGKMKRKMCFVLSKGLATPFEPSC